MADMQMIEMTRRALFTGAGRAGVAAALLGGSVVVPQSAMAADLDKVKANIKEHMGSGDYQESDTVKIDAPIIAENGAMVPVKITVDHPMDTDNYIQSIGVFVDNNPTPFAGVYAMGPANGKAYVSARLKIGKTSQVRAVAMTNTGKLIGTSKEVKVTIGGCGG
ncbi:thiosulfate-binding protein SoxY [Magnetococcus marinus MC-1]|uniref:Thiosulfate-binding protein SoxY n=1 Tax=Magnetococcus marinus (strain ATCC BAA-1437 / JCM 17883 / MC-1) TaxID=156889 RepID=A0L8X3_MAGMM|nr:thiosulfate oxidation carrier protein SoxY [Magnetococcus marinus]ABK44416.1 thiosulfate-binding protein SoxY [Magnetococcus marinus MC-1]